MNTTRDKIWFAMLLVALAGFFAADESGAASRPVVQQPLISQHPIHAQLPKLDVVPGQSVRPRAASVSARQKPDGRGAGPEQRPENIQHLGLAPAEPDRLRRKIGSNRIINDPSGGVPGLTPVREHHGGARPLPRRGLE